ncbi:MAG: hypothetical protein JW915_07895 [Chitinispirillaceae bacterium]|nr:hypothetical protein [Chitinispirillaceae bacterium]
MRKILLLHILIGALIISITTLYRSWNRIIKNRPEFAMSSLYPALTPWKGIGGCGAGGSGSKNGVLRWIGSESGSNLIGIRIMPSLHIQKLSRTFSLTPRVSIKPHWNYEIGLSIPYKSVASEIQFQTNIEQQVLFNSGIGDLTVDCSRTFGMNGQFKARADVTFPTGIYDETRGTDQVKKVLPQTLQMGQGVWSVTPALSFTHDFENSMLIFDASLYYPFVIRFDKKNEHLDADYRTYNNVTINRERFHYKHIVKPYGENDRGDYFPPAVNITTDFVIRAVEGMTQSIQFSFSTPLGVQWIHSYDKNQYDPHPDPDHRAWDALLGYGIETNRFRVPIFFGIGIPIRDKKNSSGNTYDEKPFRKWDGPDWQCMTQEIIITSGIKAALF